MKILHLCNDFSNSKVHSNLYQQIDNEGFEQFVFQPLRSKNLKDTNSLKFRISKSKIIFSELMCVSYRIFFRKKIKFLYSDLIRKICCNEIDITHATTLFSDGALAYKLYLLHNIPYVVTVRNTDVNLFLKLRPDLYFLAKNILEHASSIIFISIALKKLFFRNFFFKNIEDKLLNKIKVIPNGLDNFWLDNITLPQIATPSLRFLFIGKFDKNKNALKLIKAMSILRSKKQDLELNLVGGGGSNHNKILKIISNNNWIKYYGTVKDKKILKTIFNQNNFFLMPSKTETFGLVYLEALTQGLPVLFTKNQGIDGLFDPPVGLASNPHNEKDIIYSIEKLIINSSKYMKNISNLNFDEFRWESIFKEHYLKLYRKIAEKKFIS